MQRLSNNHIEILKILYIHKELCVSRIRGFSDSTLYAILNDLVDDGLAKYHMGESDKYKRRYVKWYYPTDKGRKYLEDSVYA